MTTVSTRVRRFGIWRGAGLIISIMLLTAPLAMAQATGTINGRVLDPGDAVLPGVTVTAVNLDTGVTRTTVTNELGAYSMPGLDPGAYSITTELAGFTPAKQDRVTLALNTTITVDFTLT